MDNKGNIDMALWNDIYMIENNDFLGSRLFSRCKANCKSQIKEVRSLDDIISTKRIQFIIFRVEIKCKRIKNMKN